MNEQLQAIQKKIQSTEEELTRLKKQLNSSSTEYVFSTEVLMKRLKDLEELKQSLQEDNNEKDQADLQEITALPETPPEYIQENKHTEHLSLRVSQEELGPDRIRVRVLAYILHSFQALLDQIGRQAKYGYCHEKAQSVQIFPESELILAASSLDHSGFQLEVHTTPENAHEEQEVTLIYRTINLLNEIENLPNLVDELAEFDAKTLALLKKWLGFMVEHKTHITISWRMENAQQIVWTGNHHNFKNGLKNLEMIRLDPLEERETKGMIVGMNIRAGILEFHEVESNRIITAKCTMGKLLQYRHSIGEEVNILLLKSVVENMESGEVKMKWIVQECTPV